MKILGIATDEVVRNFLADELREFEAAVREWTAEETAEADRLQLESRQDHFAIARHRERAKAGHDLHGLIRARRSHVDRRYEEGDLKGDKLKGGGA